MTCEYCGRENPDGTVFCECGRPLTLGSRTSSAGASSGGYGASPQPSAAYGRYTYSAPRPRRSPVVFIVIFLIALAVGGAMYFLSSKNAGKNMTDESKWKTITEPQFSITVPPAMKKGTMLTVMGGKTKHLGFYTSNLAGFDVNYYKYTNDEKELYGSLNAKDFALVSSLMTQKINDQEIKFQAREGKNYLFAEYNRHSPNYIGKSDEVWYIESMFPTAEGYYIVDTYCAQTDKAEYRESMLKWLDSFSGK